MGDKMLSFWFLGLYWSDEYRHSGIQYAVSESRASWLDARDSCLGDNATLAVVPSSELDQFLRDICPDSEATYVVIELYILLGCIRFLEYIP